MPHLLQPSPRPVLPSGSRLGDFELQAALDPAEGDDSVLYRAWDHALARQVAIAEYLPHTAARRSPDGALEPASAAATAEYAAGLARFIEQTRWLAAGDHPSLLRVHHLLQAHGTAYRVMPWYRGQTLSVLQRRMPAAPDEPALRALLDELLGALQTLHRAGHVHAGVHADNILVLDDDRALLLAPGRRDAEADAHRALGPWSDCHALAQVARLCIAGSAATSAGDPSADRSGARYSAALLRALERAASPDRASWPQSVAEFRDWLHDDAAGPPPAPAAAADTDTGVGVDAATRALIERVIASIPEHAEQSPPASPRPAAPTPAADTLQPVPARRRPRVALAAAAALVLFGVAAAAALDPARQLLAGLGVGTPEPAFTATPETPTAAAAGPALAAALAPPPATTAAAQAATAPTHTAGVQAAQMAATALDEGRLPGPSTGPAAPKAVRTATGLPAPSARKATPRASSPRQQCGERTQFSLFRCMQRLCAKPTWKAHAQCEQMRRTGDVE